MIARALLVMAGSTLLGIGLGALIGYGIGTFAPWTYMSDLYGAHSGEAAQNMGIGFGVINGSILGVVSGCAALLYDLGHRYLDQRAPKTPPNL